KSRKATSCSTRQTVRPVKLFDFLTFNFSTSLEEDCRATRNGRSGTNGRKHGAAPAARRAPVRRLCSGRRKRAPVGLGRRDRRQLARRVCEQAEQAARGLGDGA